MDLLAGYASDGDDSGSDSSPPAAIPPARAPPPARPAGGAGELFSSLPAPKLGGAPGLGGAGRKVQWKPPLRAPAASAAEQEAEEGRSKKKARSSKGASLTAMLPAPKNVPGNRGGGGPQASGLGGGLGGGLGAGGEGGTRLEAPGGGGPGGGGYVMSRPARSKEPDALPPPQPQPAAPAVAANDMYRVDAAGNYSAEAYQAYYAQAYAAPPQEAAYQAAPGPQAPPGSHQSYDYFPQEHRAAEPYQGTIETLQAEAGPAAAAAGTSAAEEDVPLGEDANGLALLQAELAREQARQARLGRKAGKAPTIVNVTQEKLKYVAPSASATANAATNAFGPQYQAELRREAGEKGTKNARRKHQIGTLYHNMKMAEVEAVQAGSKTFKSKAETAAKYGW